MDMHMDHAQHLLAKSSSLSGFQSTNVFDSINCNQVRVPTNKFVQILNVRTNHWITVSNVDCGPNTIKVYDSMCGLQYNDKFNCQVAALLDCTSDSITVVNASIKQQEGSYDCGLFSIACATSLCFGMAPENQNYDQHEMRDHLADCFRNGAILPFPVIDSPLVSRSKSSSYNILICGICRKPKSRTNVLVECMLCSKNFHSNCDSSIDPKLPICSMCQNYVSGISFS